MVHDLCLRCGTSRPESGAYPGRGRPEGLLPASAADESLGEAWWAAASGSVCPRCQTEGERQGLRTALHSAITAEVGRRASSGKDPDEVESALIEFAMSLHQPPPPRASPQP